MNKSSYKSLSLWISPLLALALYFSLPDAHLNSAGKITTAVAFLMALWWTTEALPLALTSLLPIALFPTLGVASITQTLTPYADKVIFLFMGGFMLGKAIERWNLHRRMALVIISIIGTKPKRLIGGFMITCAFFSMWISNTATVVMMLPIGMSILTLLEGHLEKNDPSARNFSLCLMLGIAYASSIGGVGTLIGSPPNALFAAFVGKQMHMEISFKSWLFYGLPLILIFLPFTWLLLTQFIYPIRLQDIPGGKVLIRDELAKLGSLKSPEIKVLAVFFLVSFLWIFRQSLSFIPVMKNLNDTSIALLGVLILGILPAGKYDGERVLSWKTARNIPWGVLLLFGGGLSLAAAMTDTGVSAFIGRQLALFGNVPIYFLILLICIVVIFLTEITSNTATVATFLPIILALATDTQISPIPLLLATTLCASFAFMLPVATPPNALVFGSGKVTIPQMCKAGLWFNIAGIFLISLWVFFSTVVWS